MNHETLNEKQLEAFQKYLLESLWDYESSRNDAAKRYHDDKEKRDRMMSFYHGHVSCIHETIQKLNEIIYL